MNEKDILTSVTNKGLFKLLANGKKTYSFSKADQQAKAEKSANR
jgi:hypothetical protein